jgi:hypothetical protein
MAGTITSGFGVRAGFDGTAPLGILQEVGRATGGPSRCRALRVRLLQDAIAQLRRSDGRGTPGSLSACRPHGVAESLLLVSRHLGAANEHEVAIAVGAQVGSVEQVLLDAAAIVAKL